MKVVAVTTRADVTQVDRDRLVVRFGTLRIAMNRDEAIDLATRIVDVTDRLDPPRPSQ